MLEIMLASTFKKLNDPGNGSGLEINPEMFEKLLADDGAAGDWFGDSVAVSRDGSTIVIGATRASYNGNDSGSAYIFTKQTNGSYLQTQKLVISDGEADDRFGISVAVTAGGSTVIVGANGDDDKGNESGSVYIFTKQANGSYLQTQKLLASDGAANDYFATSVAISIDGTTIVVGANQDDDKGSNSGSAYIFTKQANGSYLQTQKLLASDGAANDHFGYSVSISQDGSTIVVGAYLDDDKGTDSGSAFIFTRQANGSYLQTQKLLASDGVRDDQFGYSVAVSADGSTVVVGAYKDDDKGTDSGSAYVFTKQVNGSYLQTQKLVASDGVRDDQFGWSVAVSADGSTVVVSAPYDDNEKGNGSGSAYIFTKQPDGSYLQTQKLVHLDRATNSNFGHSVAISNTSVVIGARRYSIGGAAFIY